MTSVRAHAFLIGPLGQSGSTARGQADSVLHRIVRPAASVLGMDIVRADELPAPGEIILQVIQQVLAAPLVIADLSDQNPNVFYELGVRHATRKPVVHMCSVGQTLPFDIAGSRVVRFDLSSDEAVAEAKGSLRSQISAALTEPPVNPISLASPNSRFSVAPAGIPRELLEDAMTDIAALLLESEFQRHPETCRACQQMATLAKSLEVKFDHLARVFGMLSIADQLPMFRLVSALVRRDGTDDGDARQKE